MHQKQEKAISLMLPLSYEQLLRTIYNKQVEVICNVLNNEGDALLRVKVKKVFENDVFDVAYECLDLKGTDPDSVITEFK